MLIPVQPESGSRIWSVALESWLAPGGTYLRLYDRFGNLRLTQAEEEHRRAEKLAETLRSMGVDPDRL